MAGQTGAVYPVGSSKTRRVLTRFEFIPWPFSEAVGEMFAELEFLFGPLWFVSLHSWELTVRSLSPLPVPSLTPFNSAEPFFLGIGAFLSTQARI